MDHRELVGERALNRHLIPHREMTDTLQRDGDLSKCAVGADECELEGAAVIHSRAGDLFDDASLAFRKDLLRLQALRLKLTDHGHNLSPVSCRSVLVPSEFQRCVRFFLLGPMSIFE
jgi:hypothetical protein